MWKDAFERANSLDKEKVREALTKTDLETFYGHVKFAADGSNPGKEIILRQIQARQIQRRVADSRRGRQAELSARGSLLSSQVEAGEPSARFHALTGARPIAMRSGGANWLFA